MLVPRYAAPLTVSFGPSCAMAAPTPRDNAATAAKVRVLMVFIARLLHCGPQTILAASAARRTFPVIPHRMIAKCSGGGEMISPNMRKWLLPQTEEYVCDGGQ